MTQAEPTKAPDKTVDVTFVQDGNMVYMVARHGVKFVSERVALHDYKRLQDRADFDFILAPYLKNLKRKMARSGMLGPLRLRGDK